MFEVIAAIPTTAPYRSRIGPPLDPPAYSAVTPIHRSPLVSGVPPKFLEYRVTCPWVNVYHWCPGWLSTPTHAPTSGGRAATGSGVNPAPATFTTATSAFLFTARMSVTGNTSPLWLAAPKYARSGLSNTCQLVTRTPSAASTQAVANHPCSYPPSAFSGLSTHPIANTPGSTRLYTSSGASGLSPAAAGANEQVPSAAIFFATASGGRHFPAFARSVSLAVKASRYLVSSTYQGCLPGSAFRGLSARAGRPAPARAAANTASGSSVLRVSMTESRDGPPAGVTASRAAQPRPGLWGTVPSGGPVCPPEPDARMTRTTTRVLTWVGLAALLGATADGAPVVRPAHRAGPPAGRPADESLPPGAVRQLGSSRFRLHWGGQVNRVCFSPDKRYLAAATDQMAAVFDAATGRPVACIRDLTLAKPTFAIDGTLLIVGYREDASCPEVARYDPASGRLLGRVGFKGASVNFRSALSPDGLLFATVDEDRVLVFDAQSGARVASFASRDGGPDHYAFSPGGKWFGMVTDWGRFVVFDRVTGGDVCRVEVKGFFVRSFAFAPDGDRVVLASRT